MVPADNNTVFSYHQVQAGTANPQTNTAFQNDAMNVYQDLKYMTRETGNSVGVMFNTIKGHKSYLWRSS